MSSTMSKTNVMQQVNTENPTKEDKRLVRTSSLEKIRRFNTYICTQHYYFLPAILSWLKSSQSGLQTATEKTIFHFRTIIFSHFLYKLYQFGYKIIHNANSFLYKKLMVYWRFYLTFAVYLAMFVLLFEFGLCVYIMTAAPFGFLFLVGCLFLIIYINYVTHSTQLNRILIFATKDD